MRIKNFDTESLRKDNKTLTIKENGYSLIRISVKNTNDEELSLEDVFDQISKYIEDNKEKINSSISAVAAFATGPYIDYQEKFIMGYLYCKYISKLEINEKTKYEIEFTERLLSEEESRVLVADFIDKHANYSKQLASKIRKGNAKPEDLETL